MRIGKVITKVADEKLRDVGFVRIDSAGTLSWIYERDPGGGKKKQIIGFQKSRHGQNITLNFGGYYKLHFLFPRDSLPPLIDKLLFGFLFPGWTYYSDAQDLEEKLTVLVDFTIERAVPLLEVMRRPFLIGTRDMHQTLEEDHEKRAERFAEENSLTFAGDVAGVKEQLVKVEEIVSREWERPFEELTEFFIDVGSYLGELILCVHGGEWKWSENRNYLIEGLNEVSSIHWVPMNVAVNYWNKPELYIHSISKVYRDTLVGLGIEKNEWL